MSIKIISINPDAIYSAEKNILKLEEKTNNNIKKIHDAVVDCYDEIDIAKYLKTGENTIAILVCYYGKHGFSWISSNKGNRKNTTFSIE